MSRNKGGPGVSSRQLAQDRCDVVVSHPRVELPPLDTKVVDMSTAQVDMLFREWTALLLHKGVEH